MKLDIDIIQFLCYVNFLSRVFVCFRLEHRMLSQFKRFTRCTCPSLKPLKLNSRPFLCDKHSHVVHVLATTKEEKNAKSEKKVAQQKHALFVPRYTFCYEDSDRYVTSTANTSITCACHVNAMQVVIVCCFSSSSILLLLLFGVVRCCLYFTSAHKTLVRTR